jgi:hypothetical protein
VARVAPDAIVRGGLRADECVRRYTRLGHVVGIDFRRKVWQNSSNMSRWNINAPTLLILSIVVCFMLVIVVLPDVDLPDTAFQRGTAPLVVHARATVAPAVVAVAALFHFPQVIQFWHPERELELVASTLDPNFRPILLRSIRR